MHDLDIHGGLFCRSSINDVVQAVNYTVRQPIGVAGLITPWNLPLYLLTWKVLHAYLASSSSSLLSDCSSAGNRQHSGRQAQ